MSGVDVTAEFGPNQGLTLHFEVVFSNTAVLAVAVAILVLGHAEAVRHLHHALSDQVLPPQTWGYFRYLLDELAWVVKLPSVALCLIGARLFWGLW